MTAAPVTQVTIPFDPTALEPVEGVEYVRWLDGDPVEPLAGTRLWVPEYSARMDFAGIIAQMPALRAIQTQSAGVDNIVDSVPSSVRLCNARGVHDAATSELGVALILAALRGLPDFVHLQARGEWDQQLGRASLADRRVLIIGYGSIGQALERRLTGFEVEITRVARTARDGIHAFTELPALVPEAEVIVLLTPLTADTHHLVDRDFLARMRDGALLVNLSRGPVVDTDALLAENGRIGAALDVTDPEPLPAGHPLWTAPGVLITPHVGGGTTAMRSRINRLIVDQARRLVAGEDFLNVIPR